MQHEKSPDFSDILIATTTDEHLTNALPAAVRIPVKEELIHNDHMT